MTRSHQPGVEWRILVQVCRGVEHPSDVEQLRGLLDPGFNVGELLEQALRHRLLALLVHTLDATDLWGYFPGRIANQLQVYQRANARRNRVFTDEARLAVAALEAAGVPVACTKGVVFQYSLFRDTGTRVFNDVDLMIRPEDVEPTRRVMAELGYVIGEYDYRSNTIRKLGADKRMMYRISPDHLPHHMRLRDDPEVPLCVIDFAYSLTWADAEWQVPMDEVLAARSRVTVPAGHGLPGCELPRLTDPYLFLFAVLHLFREAWFERTIRMGKGTLDTFTDIYRFWRDHGEQIAGPVGALVEKHGLWNPVRWVTGHTDAIFGTRMTGALGLTADEADPWMRSACSARGEQVLWSGSIQERLWRTDPLEFQPLG